MSDITLKKLAERGKNYTFKCYGTGKDKVCIATEQNCKIKKDALDIDIEAKLERLGLEWLWV